jgi:pyruvate,water dikinase
MFVGGKAANLGRMLEAGLPVPGGFCVSTAGFRLWIETNSDAAPLLDRLDHLAPEAAAEIRETAAALRRSLAASPVPEPVEGAIRAIAAPGPWAVRSSATAEDLPEASFAGQHDSVLNVRGPEPLLDAVRGCWASLFSDRAVFYRLKNRIPNRAVAMAVVVQEMVPAEVSGVMFTANPLTGDTTRMVIEGAPGLGESLVSGKVNPDRRMVDKEPLRVIEPAGPGQPCLTDAIIGRLGELGLRAERLFGGPQDIEWAARDGQVFLLQSRPITALPLAPLPEHEVGAAPEVEVWTNANIMEALPDVVVPMAWSFMQVLFNDFLYPVIRRLGLDPDRRPLVQLIAGRAYLNVRTLSELVQQPGGPIQIDAIAAFGGLHNGLGKVIRFEPTPGLRSMNLPRLLRLARLVCWLLPGLIGQRGLIERWGRRVFGDLARTPPTELSDEQLAAHPFALLRLATLTEAAAPASLARSKALAFLRPLMPGEAHRTTAAAVWMAAGAVGGSTGLFYLARRWLGDTDRSLANRLLAGAEEMWSAENGLALLRLAAWGRGHPALKQALLEPMPFAALEGKLAGVARGLEFLERWRAFMESHGHQARGGMDLFQPRWSEMPDFVLDNLRVYLRFDETSDPLVLQARQRREREVLLAQCRKRLRNPLKRWLFTFLVRTGRRGLAQRENVKNDGVRLVAVVRRIALEAGRRLVARGALSRPDDVFYLRLEELGPVLLGRPAFDVSSVIAARKADYARDKLLCPPPVIVGRYEPDAREPVGAIPQPRTLQGLPVSPGLVIGRARVILQADAAGRVQPGEILVAPYTDPGWTPYFLAAAGIVVDVGGLLSHGSVVAREYGIPAVVNVGPATRLIRTGQRLEVDGNRGTVTILD